MEAGDRLTMWLTMRFGGRDGGHWILIYDRASNEFWDWISAGRIRRIEERVDMEIRERTRAMVVRT